MSDDRLSEVAETDWDGYDDVESEVGADLLPRWTQQDWMADAACRGQWQYFFPPPGERPKQRAEREGTARSICASCPVIETCRAYARYHREHGFWGGESEEERMAAGYPPLHPIVPRSVRRKLSGTVPAA